MGTRKKYTYHPRKTRTGYVWEYTINEEAGLPSQWCERRRSSGIAVKFGRNGKPTQRSADEIMRFCLKRIEQLRSEYKESFRKTYDPTLWDIIEPYYDYERCPHIQRELTDGRSITHRWAADQRDRLEKYVRDYSLAEHSFSQLIPADFEDWKREMRQNGVRVSVINKTISALKTAINNELELGNIRINPIAGVKRISAEEEDRGYFTLEELRKMFIEKSPGCWKAKRNAGSKYGKVPAETARLMGLWQLLTGERMKAILELKWQDIDFENKIVTYQRTKTQTGRMVPLPETLVKELREHQDRSIRLSPENYVFSYDSGDKIGYTLFRTRYENMKEALKLPEKDPDGGKRTPYSLKVSLETYLIDEGADPVHVREYMGHSHGSGEKRLTRVQSRYKRRRVEVLRERIIPVIDNLLVKIDKVKKEVKL